MPDRPDLPELLAALDLFALLHGDRPLGHVAVLRVEPLAMAQQHAIAAFATLQGFAAARARDPDVLHAVARPEHDAVRGGPNLDAGLLHGERRYPDIDPVMAVIAERETLEVAEIGTWVVIEQVLDRANHTGRADDGGGKLDGKR